MGRMFQIARLLLGLIFVIFGLNGFLKFIPVPPFHPFVQVLVSTGYIYFIKAIEVLSGGLLVVNRALLLALVLLGADIANIVAYHALLDHRNWPAALIVAVLYGIVFSGAWPRTKVLFQWSG